MVVTFVGSSQVPPRPLSLLQKVAQDAKRRTLTSSQGGLGLARELSQAHSIPPAGVLQPPKFQSPAQRPAQAPQPSGNPSGDMPCCVYHNVTAHRLVCLA